MRAQNKSSSRVVWLPRDTQRGTSPTMMKYSLQLSDSAHFELLSLYCPEEYADPSNGCSDSFLEWRTRSRNLHAAARWVC